MHRALSSLVAALVALGLTGCSGDEPVAQREPESSPPAASASDDASYESDLARLYAGNSTDPQDASDGECFSAALLERLDEQALIEAGILTADAEVVATLPVFDEATAGTWVDAQLSCVDYVEASTRALLTQRRGNLDAEEYAACLRTALSADEFRAALVQSLSGGFDTPEVAALTAAQSTCVE